MKELWIEVDESIPDHVKNSLLKSAAQVCDVLLVGLQDVENARKTGAKTAASSGDCDINVLETFDEGEMMKLKKGGEPLP